jgi:hypothetical protein
MSLNVLEVIERAGRIHGLWAAGVAPGPNDGADALVAFNALKRSWFGTLIGPRLSPLPLSGVSGQAENGGEYQIPGGAAFTLTAPLNPRGGARFGVVDVGLSWGATPLTIAGNGRQIGGVVGSTTISTAGQNTRWWFRGDTGSWIVEADFAGLNAAIEFPDPIIAYMPYMLAVAIADEFGADVSPSTAMAAAQGSQAIARAYGRRGRANPEGPIGLPAPPAPAGGQG